MLLRAACWSSVKISGHLLELCCDLDLDATRLALGRRDLRAGRVAFHCEPRVSLVVLRVRGRSTACGVCVRSLSCCSISKFLRPSAKRRRPTFCSWVDHIVVYDIIRRSDRGMQACAQSLSSRRGGRPPAGWLAEPGRPVTETVSLRCWLCCLNARPPGRPGCVGWGCARG